MCVRLCFWVETTPPDSICFVDICEGEPPPLRRDIIFPIFFRKANHTALAPAFDRIGGPVAGGGRVEEDQAGKPRSDCPSPKGATQGLRSKYVPMGLPFTEVNAAFTVALFDFGESGPRSYDVICQ